ncbi:hypothetical protein Q7C18_02700 [Nesterenkonia sp. CL21]|uniref:dTMP kinase n=1 Tax=Nesterenkonia sp. CL21 TaxID=3064894 RepID=UPI00287A29CC|nr:hypothetical protein [Nesterenkonia sp. CL21]MDS2171598.1 hypothetical protein [Nesterenkonia sp. CL21]
MMGFFERHGRHPYIILEGIDGTGKSTQVDMLDRHLIFSHGCHPSLASEPHFMETADHAHLAHTADAKALAYEVDRMDAEEGLVDAIRDGYPVIQDRSFYSTLAYQNPSWEIANFLLRPRKLEPDLVFLLDMPAVAARSRLEARGALDGYEASVEYQEAVRWRYRQLLVGNHKARLVDATQPAESIASYIASEVDKVMTL